MLTKGITIVQNKFDTARRALHENLSVSTLEKYSVKEVCQITGYTKSTFYRQFQSLPIFLACCMSHEVRNHLNKYREQDLVKKFKYLLIKMKQDEIYFCNIYYLSKSKQCICEYFVNELRSFFKQYLLNKYGDYSYELVKRASNNIYRVLFTWVEHYCKDNVEELMGEISVFLFLLENSKSLSNIGNVLKEYTKKYPDLH